MSTIESESTDVVAAATQPQVTTPIEGTAAAAAAAPSSPVGPTPLTPTVGPTVVSATTDPPPTLTDNGLHENKKPLIVRTTSTTITPVTKKPMSRHIHIRSTSVNSLIAASPKTSPNQLPKDIPPPTPLPEGEMIISALPSEPTLRMKTPLGHPPALIRFGSGARLSKPTLLATIVNNTNGGASPHGSRSGSRQPSPVRNCNESTHDTNGKGPTETTNSHHDLTIDASTPGAPTCAPSPRHAASPSLSSIDANPLTSPSPTSPTPPLPSAEDASSSLSPQLPSDPPIRKRRVFFNDTPLIHAPLDSRHPTPSHSRQSSASHSTANHPLKSALKLPPTHMISLHMNHVVKQAVAANSNEPPSSPQLVALSPPTPFSLHAPYAAPAALLRLQVSLFHDACNLDAYCTTVTRTGAILYKYNQSGKPMKRWFYVLETKDELKLCWSAPKTSKTKPLWEVNPNGLDYHDDEHEQLDANGKPILNKKSRASQSAPHSSSSLLPAFTIGKWKFNQDRSRSLLEVSGIHYGPYYSANFCRFLEKQDSANGKPWLCFSVQFKDRTIDLVCSNEHEVTAWFLGLQAQAPQTCYHMTRGMILWQRLIMKLNYYGLDQIKRVFAKRANMATTSTTTSATLPHASSYPTSVRNNNNSPPTSGI